MSHPATSVRCVITLMTYSGPVDVQAAVTRTGGIPLVPSGFSWPTCAECAGPMQFVGQVVLDEIDPRREGDKAGRGLLSIFMCQNDPGLCEEWDPAAGGNKALLFQSNHLAPALVPPGDDTLLPEACGISLKTVEGTSYYEASNSWSQAEDRPLSDVLGQLGGEPDWLQNDETPACPSCAAPMCFVAQLDEGHDHTTAINFGGGYGYAFACEPCGHTSFLWQC
jgi:uncharacterized protein YwqG